MSGIGRDNIIQSVVALTNPFKSETNLTERQDPYVMVISQAFAIGWQRNMIWNVKTMVYAMVNMMS